MEIVYPLVISSVAVLITLAYACALDLRSRRVPFICWFPMLGTGVLCTTVFLWQNSARAGLIIDYLAIVAFFLYTDYLDNRGRTDSFGLVRYYKEGMLPAYLSIVLILPALSWFAFSSQLDHLIPWYLLFAGILICVSYIEYTGKPGDSGQSVPINMLTRWFFLLIVLIFSITLVLMIPGPEGWGVPALVLLLLTVFSGIYYLFAHMHLFGGADAWALIFINFSLPASPFLPLLSPSPLGLLSFSVLVNALLLNLAAPLGIFLFNALRGNKAPLMYMFFGFPVDGSRIRESWGFVMEDFETKNGKVNRRFIGFWDAIRRMYSGEGRIYTKDLREHPEEFVKELALYKEAGAVWISYAVPFIIPITAGLITTLLLGDILFSLMKVIL